MEKADMRFAKLHKLTSDLPILENLVKNMKDDIVIYEAEGGDVIGIGLYKSDDISVQKANLPAGTFWPFHKHEAIERLIVYVGKLKVEKSGGGCFDDDTEVVEKILEVGDSVKILPNTPHCVTALEDTWVLGVIIPDDKGYPNAR